MFISIDLPSCFYNIVSASCCSVIGNMSP